MGRPPLEERTIIMTVTDTRQFSAASENNRAPILSILNPVLPRTGLILEIASGSGQHAIYFSDHLPGLSWQPSDPDPAARASILAWSGQDHPRVLPPLALDVTDESWPIGTIDGLVAINMVHIAPWSATLGLFAGARRHLRAGGPIFLYGPYLEADVPTAQTNLTFDANLRRRNPAWGLRDLADVTRVAAANGFRLDEKHAMPANNLSLVFRQSDSTPMTHV